jgi:hypothetical protein
MKAMRASEPMPVPIPAFAPVLRLEDAEVGEEVVVCIESVGLAFVVCVESAGLVFVGGLRLVGRVTIFTLAYSPSPTYYYLR